ncbi:PHP domain-containing protein [Ectothiorhodospiraceae bacterium BW-2]|nr:PHP domain-containing protein [Ectothiorhodospiraceae bacterium BW-2]
MYLTIDLHSHSSASDGSLSPTELVTLAHRLGVRTLALTDHDELNGLAEAAGAARLVGMELVSGVEISVSWERQTIHIVGLGIDPESEALQQGLVRLRQFRHWRAEEMGRRLDKQQIGGIYERAARLAQGRIISRTHFAMALVERGYAKQVGEVFRHFLRAGKPGHVAGEWAELSEAVGWIRAAGGVAVVAHPARYSLSRAKLCRLFEAFIDAGGEAIEVVSGSQSAEDAARLAPLALKYRLYASAGSDFHSEDRPWHLLGRLPPLPNTLQPVWQLLELDSASAG